MRALFSALDLPWQVYEWMLKTHQANHEPVPASDPKLRPRFQRSASPLFLSLAAREIAGLRLAGKPGRPAALRPARGHAADVLFSHAREEAPVGAKLTLVRSILVDEGFVVNEAKTAAMRPQHRETGDGDRRERRAGPGLPPGSPAVPGLPAPQ